MQPTSRQSFRDLIRSAEGVLDRANYLRGVIILGALTLGILGIFYLLQLLRGTMDWMTVAVAPFLGVLVLFAVSSLVYFWFCIFIKRCRALTNSAVPVYLWLLAILAAVIFKLLDYQNQTLGLATEGWLTYTNSASILVGLCALGLFLFVLLSGFAKRR